jgi:integrase
MARKVRDKELDSREARSKLKPRGKPYRRLIEPGLHLGYRRIAGRSGTWDARHYKGGGQYEIERIGIADDLSDSDGVAILDYWQAVDEARKRMVARAHAAAGKTGPLTVRDVIEQYLEWMRGNRKSAYDATKRAEAFILPVLGDIECERLTTDAIYKWHVDLSKRPPRVRTRRGGEQQHRSANGDEDAVRRRQASANRVLTTLKAALNRTWRQGEISSDAAWRRVEPFADTSGVRLRYLTIAECRRLINACTPAFRDLVHAALMCGARYGEIARLRVADFDGHSGTLVIAAGKTGKARRVILNEEAIQFFDGACAGKRAEDRIFVRNGRGESWGASHQFHHMREACARAKIASPVGFHQLRHTYASHCVMNGVPIAVVAENLGHSVEVCARHYAHLAPSYKADAIRAGAPRFGTMPQTNVRTLR